MANSDATRLHRDGLLALQAGDFGAAIGQIGQAARLALDNAEYHFDLGLALRGQGHLQEARATFHIAALLDPGNPAPRAAMADMLVRLNRLEEAADAYRTAQQLAPHEPKFYHALGLVLEALGQGAAGTQMLRAATTLAPENAAMRRDLAVGLNNLGLAADDPWNALAALDEAARTAPEDLDIRNNLGVALRDLDRNEGALACFDAVLAVDPSHAPAHLNAASVLLMRGEFDRGWDEFEWRDHVPGATARAFAAPRWQGEALAGRALLVHAEMGLGDTIQFCRFVPRLGGTARLLVPAALRRLLSTLPGATLANGDAFDLHCPLLSLPRILGVGPTDLAPTPYLHADAAAVAGWTTRMAGLDGLKIGVCWAGGRDYDRDRERSLPASGLARLAIPGAALVSLQKDAAPPGGVTIADWTDELTDLADTAALIAALDMVVSVDTAVAHLAGALGKPVLLMDRFAGDWRWMRGRQDSPWYPTLRIFRQTTSGDWDSVLGAVAGELVTGSHQTSKSAR